MSQVNIEGQALLVSEFDSKSPLQSQTIWGGIVVVGSSASGAYTAYKAGNMELFGASLAALFGGVTAIVGRFKAKQPITK